MADLFERIESTDYATKGIRVKNNPLGLSVADAQRAFDELTLDVVIPKFNTLADALNDLDLSVRVNADDIRGIRLNEDNVIEVTLDGETWEATGSSGHIILDGDGVQYAQRSRLQFLNVNITDDGTATVIEGLQGIQGEQGEQGIQGEKGDKGDTGDLGPAWLPVISSNGDLNWTQSSTTIAPATVNIRGPQGVQGVQGVQGETGPQGAQGIQGVQGVQGIQGEKGDTGDTGATGPQGIQGIQGVQGEKGDTGETGATGAVGPTGATGPQGVQGPTGAQGPKGEDGADGKNFSIQDVYSTYAALVNALPDGDEYAYQVEEDQGIYIWSENESDWVNLGQLQGPTGAQGPQGEQGIQGIQGVQGIQGETGPQGEQGIQGIQGEAGQSAYEAAINAGYTGTEAEFNAALAVVPSSDQQAVWTAKVGSVNGIEGTAITLVMSDIQIIDDTTGTAYKLGINNGGLYYEEVE